jgi:nitrogen regulatory protein PII-like uncharacterized protein
VHEEKKMIININATPATTSVLDGNPNALTSEGLMLYLQTRLDGLDEQINAVFKKQKDIENIRKALMKIQNTLETLDDDKKKNSIKNDTYRQAIEDAINEIESSDPALAAKMRAELSVQGQILYNYQGNNPNHYAGSEVPASKEYVNNLMKQLESSAQLEMIGLQSTMSARQTAIQLATNLVSALNKGTDAIAANVGR